MPGGVIEVSRRLRPGWLGRLDPLPLLALFWVARRRGRIEARRLREQPDVSSVTRVSSGAVPLRRGMPVLVADSRGQPRCVACGLCACACPARCLTVVAGDHPEDPSSRRPDRFDLDLGRCMLCGLCEEACPEAAIVMSEVVPETLPDWSTLWLDRDALLVSAERLAGPLARRRGATGTTPQPGDAGRLPEQAAPEAES